MRPRRRYTTTPEQSVARAERMRAWNADPERRRATLEAAARAARPGFLDGLTDDQRRAYYRLIDKGVEREEARRVARLP